MGRRRIHVIGAGLAGLSAAIRLVDLGHEVTLYEAARHAGGRCRSYFDDELGCRIDNGNHLLLTANRAAMRYVERIGATGTLIGPAAPRFDFYDLSDETRWALAPGSGRVPWWILDPARRVPGTRARDYWRLARLRRAPPDATIAQALDTTSALFRRLLQPFAVAALNTEIETGSAALLWQLLVESFGAGGAALRPLVPRQGLSESLVDPALACLRAAGADIRFGARLRAVGRAGDEVNTLVFEDAAVELGPEDRAILAVPAPVAMRLLPEIDGPDAFRAIVNAHYRVPTDEAEPLFIGLVGGTAEWVFRKPGILSVTVSAADRLLDIPAEALAEELWKDVAHAYRRVAEPLPPHRIIKEKRATFAATPDQLARRPGAATPWRNLFLAGDWTATGLPATIEGAIRSGETAARIANAAAEESLTKPDMGVTQSRHVVAG